MTLHLTGYGVHLLLFALTLLYPVVLIVATAYPSLVSLFGIALIFNFTALAPTAYFMVAQQALGRRWLYFLPAILFMTVLGGGMMLNTVRAALQAGLGRKAAFERTPKYGIARSGQAWEGSRYQVRIDGLVMFELVLATLNLGTVWLSWRTSNWPVMFYAFLFALGLFFTSGMTLVQYVRQRFLSQPRRVMS